MESDVVSPGTVKQGAHREAVVLAGGLGLRLRSMISDVPKVMAVVDGRPFLEILLSLLERKGFKRVVLSVGHMADNIIHRIGDSFGELELVYEIEKEPLGTGGAVKGAMLRCTSDHVFVFNGDTYFDAEIDEIESFWKEDHIPVIVGCEVPDTSRYGRLDVSGAFLSGFEEKISRGPGVINSGCYVFPRNYLEDFPREGAFSLEKDVFPEKLRNGRLKVFVSKGFFIDIGIPEDLARARRLLKEGGILR